jgi:hypothetical protein
VTDYTWPDDLVPFQQSFYLQPHTGGSESPFSRVSKIYGLSAPRWICSMSFRGGYWGANGLEAVGPRLDALIAKLKGRQNRALIYDFRRPVMRGRQWLSGVGNSAAALGATSITVTGLQPGQTIRAGDYIGGDGRPHIITDDVTADSTGQAVVTFEPPLKAAIALNAAVFGNPTGIFRLTDDDAGANGIQVGEAVSITLSFVEDL